MKRLITLFFLVSTASASAEAQDTPGCTDAAACNYDVSATQDDGSCDYCSCPEVVVATSADFLTDGYGLRVELVSQHDGSAEGLEALAGMNTYRIYAVTPSSSDRVTAVSGSAGGGILEMNAPGGFYQDALGSIAGTGIQPLLFTAGFPTLEYDSWVTIGADASPSMLGLGFETVSTAADPAENWISLFEPGSGATGSSFSMTTVVGGGWFAYPSSSNAVPDGEGKVLLGQFTTSGALSGLWNIQFVQGGGVDLRLGVSFTTEGLGEPTWSQPESCPCDSDVDSDGICDEFDACTDTGACNFLDPYNLSCLYLDACGVCGGPGIPLGDCDCDGNVVDVIGVCGGTCASDEDSDGICDDLDDCVGTIDACGICNGPGEIYACGCLGIPLGDCDCDGNQLDAVGECGGTCLADSDGDGVCDDAEVPGCTNPYACNYDPTATDDDGSCATDDAIGDCGGSCTSDADGDGICDDIDDCVGTLDACGVCNGPGEIYACGCAGIPAGDCDCDGNQLDALGICGGTCTADSDGDGVCDDAEVPGCTNPFACNYDAAATDDDGTCASDDAIGDCGGACTSDADGDGICDVIDDCVGTLDACGICNGPGEVYACGCAGIPAGDCDCGGNQLDALGICGGSCASDADGDGICDDIDDCVGALDACGICNGPGEIYSCGCTGIPAGDCDCDGNQLDALGICGGTCTADSDGDGVCDDAEVPGCTAPYACNYDPTATDDDGSCATDDAIGDCGGSCTSDADGDGICDDIDDCVGTLDACGICNGPGEIYTCGCAGIPAGDCDCDGNQLDALGICGGTCTADSDGDGVCDDAEVPGCTNPFACNYDAAATDDDGTCASDDAIGDCGGACTSDADGDGICDVIDDCVGTLDDCGICNGPVRCMPVAAREFQPVIATVVATSLTPWATAADPVLLMRMAMAPAMISTTAWAPSTRAVFAMVPARFIPAVAREFQSATATVTVTSWTPWASAAVPAQRIRMATAYVTTQKYQVARTRLLATTTPQPPMMMARVHLTTPLAIVAAPALRMRTAMAYATISTTAWALSTPAGYATVPAKSMPAVVRESRPAIATVTATSWTPWASVAAPARRIRMATAYATSQRFQVARIRLPATMTLRQRMTTAPVKRQTLWAIAVVIAVRMQMATASVMTRTIASACSMLVVSVQAPALSLIAAARAF